MKEMDVGKEKGARRKEGITETVNLEMNSKLTDPRFLGLPKKQIFEN